MAIDKIREGEQRIASQSVQRIEQQRLRKELYTTSHLETRQQSARLVDITGMLASSEQQVAREPLPGLGEGPSSVFIKGVGRIEIPTLEKTHREMLEELYAKVAPEHREAFIEASRQLGDLVIVEVESNSAFHTGQFSPEFVEASTSAYRAYQQPIGHDDLQPNSQASNELDQLMQMALYGAEKYLRDFLVEMSQKIEQDNDTKAALAELEEMLEDWPDDGSTELFSYSELVKQPDGSYKVVQHNNVELGKEEATALALKLKLQLETTGSMSAMAQAELQRRVQQHRRATEAISNILKVQHDTQKAILGNLR